MKKIHIADGRFITIRILEFYTIGDLRWRLMEEYQRGYQYAYRYF